MKLDNISISKKLSAAFAMIVAVIIALGAVTFVQLRNLEATKAAVIEGSHVIALTTAMKRSVDQQESNVRAFIASPNEHYAERIAIHRENFANKTEELRPIVAKYPGAEGRLAALTSAVENYRVNIIERELALAADPATHAQAIAMMTDGVAAQFMDPVDTAFDAIIEAQDRRLETALVQQEDAFRTAMIALAIGILAAIGLAVTFGLTLSRSIAVPVSAMTSVMRRLAGGDLTAEVRGAHRKDEIGHMAEAVQAFKDAGIAKQRMEAEKAIEAQEDQVVITTLGQGLSAMANGDLTHRITVEYSTKAQSLKTDFNAAISQLQDAMSVVVGNVAAIRSGAGEISQASDDLSKRTEQQAASLEETAAALDQITATVARTATGANQASELVGAARSDADKSGEIVRTAVNAMSAIERSSSEISNIIGVIDEIAFQTNLLALNAGVEAARAGDAGRGFAVVASEVRALAQRSAEAAKEIKTLISASSQQVEQGVELVGQAGDSLNRIASRVAEINGLVTEIAASAQEQATGLHQINTAVNQMDQVTQQNAAMVEEATAASHSLAQEAEVLAGSVARFDIGQPKATHAAPVRAAAPSPVRAPAPARTSARPAAPSLSPRTVAAMKTVGTGGAALKPAEIEDGWEEF